MEAFLSPVLMADCRISIKTISDNRVTAAVEPRVSEKTRSAIRRNDSSSKGNFFRLFLGMILTFWPLVFIGVLTGIDFLGYDKTINRTEFVFQAIGVQVFSLTACILYVSFLSIAYRHLVTETEVGDGSPS